MCVYIASGVCVSVCLRIYIAVEVGVGFPDGSMVRNPSTNAAQTQLLVGEDPLEKEMATNSSILA